MLNKIKIKGIFILLAFIILLFSCSANVANSEKDNESKKEESIKEEPTSNIGGNEISFGKDDVIVNIPDENFEEVIRDALDKPSGNIYKSDMEKIIKLEANDRGIEKLDGMQYCINIELLNLNNNKISEIKSLRKCSKIYLLSLSSNNLDYNDIYYMQDLNNLRFLYLDYNKINDLKYIKYLLDNPLDFINIENNKMTIDFDNTNRNARIIRDLLATGTTIVAYKNGNTVIGKP